MLSAFLLPWLLALQVAGSPDSGAVVLDTACRSSKDGARPGRCRTILRPATAAEIATAFDSPAAASLLARARLARMTQDSALVSYDAVARQRATVKLKVTSVGRERLLFRYESASRVRWHRDVGVLIDVLGNRAVAPILEGSGDDGDLGTDMHETTPIPYFPGRETLWTGYRRADQADGDDWTIHPMVRGAEAHYRYAIGDSVGIELPSGQAVRLIELQVRARAPRWDLIVGSFWFDAGTAQLVRAAYRMAVPVDIWTVVEEDEDDIPPAVQALITPLTGSIDAVVVEYGLHEGRFWLPRSQSATGHARAGFMRVPFRLEQSFRYASVRADEDLATHATIAAASQPGAAAGIVYSEGFDSDTIPALDDGRTIVIERARAAEQGRSPAYHPCAPGDTAFHEERRFGGALMVRVRVPCDSALLATSSELPPSIYDDGEALFGAAEREELLRSLDLSTQAAWSPQPPVLIFGLDRQLLRFNRVEGLSAGLGVRSALGRGYTAEATGQIGTGDWEPNADLRLWRSNGRRTVGTSLYRRLTAANDWGSPLGAGNSLNALLFGHDEGFYYRTLGIELTGTDHERSLQWRLFAERQSRARVQTQASLAHALNEVRFVENIEAARGDVAGASLRWVGTHGSDPRRLRLTVDARAEGALGDFAYARGAADLTMSHRLSDRLGAALTIGAGSTAGDVPPQRLWYLGGAHTIRGQRAGPGEIGASGVGNAYWMTRAELAAGGLVARPVVFYDIGWAGDRDRWADPGEPLSGAGIGASFFDGVVRLDLARGIRPRDDWRLALYLEGRF